MRKASKTAFVVCSVLFVMIVHASRVQAGDSLQYIGSSTVGKFMHEAAKEYKDASFNINTKPESGGGENATVVGRTDLGGVAREVKPQILEKGVKKFLIGKDAIGVWVNAGNPVASLTADQVKGIFTGQIRNWKEVGYDDATINIYIVNTQSATRKVFSQIIMDGEKYNGKVTTIRPDPAIMEKVAADKYGIGHLSFALGNGHPQEEAVKKISIGDQAPSVNNPDYPIFRPLYLITKGEPEGAAKNFIEWTTSEAGQKIVKKYFIGIK